MHAVDFVLPSFAAGGAERVLLSFAAALDRNQFAPRIVVLDPTGPLAGTIGTLPDVERLSGGRLRHSLRQLVSVIREHRPAVIFSSQAHVNLALLAVRPFLGGAKLVVREANMPSLCLANGHWPRWYRFFYGPLMRQADTVVATSAQMRSELVETFKVSDARIRTIFNPVDVATIRAKAAGADHHPGPNRSEESGRHFLAVGRLVRQKGFDRLIQWFTDCPPTDRLTILGEGPERASLQSQIQAAGLGGRVHLHGHSENPWAAMVGADAVVMPSRWEGMPNVALESLTVGTPVIATAASGAIAELSAAAPDAVTVAQDGEAFVKAMTRHPAKSRPGLGQCLLPAQYHLSQSTALFQELVAEQCGSER